MATLYHFRVVLPDPMARDPRPTLLLRWWQAASGTRRAKTATGGTRRIGYRGAAHPRAGVKLCANR